MAERTGRSTRRKAPQIRSLSPSLSDDERRKEVDAAAKRAQKLLRETGASSGTAPTHSEPTTALESVGHAISESLSKAGRDVTHAVFSATDEAKAAVSAAEHAEPDDHMPSRAGLAKHLVHA